MAGKPNERSNRGNEIRLAARQQQALEQPLGSQVIL
jgi:hypothetical protein